MKTKRIFKPRATTSIAIDRWEWSRRKGLWVVYFDGLTCPSEYTLPELLKTERPVEVTS